ncbi:MAG: toll/interleukin-1 receptor domain-containing protein [Phycisphaerales bacterium]|nr:toll/interleukin-1 receptor domain-containing protein [Phycisphaerales bacterium]
MTASDSKKIFLSHKGVDKEIVVDFKKTLEAFGYAPWLDEDAMPAGTHLERGILKGMQESCGVIFFITPSFKDEGYLETEVNYAIQGKRAKGDKFAIIALQFVGPNGSVGEIPDLLKSYVWKKPKSHLEALREIIRALPISAGAVDWRSEITYVFSVHGYSRP